MNDHEHDVISEAHRRRVDDGNHQQRIGAALYAVELALASAGRNGRRTDCLRCAVADLRGALANVEAEDRIADVRGNMLVQKP